MPKVFTKRLFNQRGITLIELIAVILIIGIIAAVGVPVVFNQIQGANEAADEANMAVLNGALERYVLLNGGGYPDYDADATLGDNVNYKISDSTDNAVVKNVEGLIGLLEDSAVYGGPYLKDFPTTLKQTGKQWAVDVKAAEGFIPAKAIGLKIQ